MRQVTYKPSLDREVVSKMLVRLYVEELRKIKKHKAYGDKYVHGNHDGTVNTLLKVVRLLGVNREFVEEYHNKKGKGENDDTR